MDNMKAVEFLILFAMLLFLFDIARSLRRGIADLRRSTRVLMQLYHRFVRDESSLYAHEDHGYTLWIFKQGKWILLEQYCPPNTKPGPAPTLQGEFENQVVRVDNGDVESVSRVSAELECATREQVKVDCVRV